MRLCSYFVSMLFIVAGLQACAPMKFVVEAIPASNKLTETVVMEDSGASAKTKIALIEMNGMISDARRRGLIAPGDNPVAVFAESLEKARKDPKVKAIIIRLNSPGGTVTASDVVYREVLYFKRESKKPVVMLMADVAASGAFYLSCAGDEVIAAPTTITGSIGVIIQTFNFSEGMRKIGIRADSITSGPNKAMGSPFEPMPAEHRELLQGLVNEFYANFRNIVETSKPNLSPADIDWITDGRVITGNRAAELGLVDSTGDLRGAFAAAKKRANIESAKLVKYHKSGHYVGSPYATVPNQPASTQINMFQLNMDSITGSEQSGFYYLWDPSISW